MARKLYTYHMETLKCPKCEHPFEVATNGLDTERIWSFCRNADCLCQLMISRKDGELIVSKI